MTSVQLTMGSERCAGEESRQPSTARASSKRKIVDRTGGQGLTGAGAITTQALASDFWCYWVLRLQVRIAAMPCHQC
jgi:hypothetical protein